MMSERSRILAMLQPEAMPGSYLNQGRRFPEIAANLMAEARQLAEIGYDGFILQNMHDGPLRQQAQPQTLTFMTALAVTLRKTFPDKLLGILVNWDGVASLAVAEAAQADFIRVEYLYTGLSVSLCGLVEGQCAEILELKKKLGSTMPVYADAQEVSGHFLGAPDKIEEAVRIVQRAYADGLFLSGKDQQESLALLEKLRPKLPQTPVILGGRATGDNIYELMKVYDGVSVATWIKDGDMHNPVNLDKARFFYNEARRGWLARKNHG